MARQITWSLHTEVGTWATSYNTARIGNYLSFLGNYWDIYFTRNNNGRVKFILSYSQDKRLAAWTNQKFECRINVGFNFISSSRDLICAMVACHEFGHMVRPQGVNGNVHSTKLGLMHPNSNMPAGNLYESDYPWFDAYPKKESKRPHEEPNRMRATFSPILTANVRIEVTPTLEYGCNHQVVKRPWYDVRPKSWVIP